MWCDGPCYIMHESSSIAVARLRVCVGVGVAGLHPCLALALPATASPSSTPSSQAASALPPAVLLAVSSSSRSSCSSSASSCSRYHFLQVQPFLLHFLQRGLEHVHEDAG